MRHKLNSWEHDLRKVPVGVTDLDCSGSHVSVLVGCPPTVKNINLNSCFSLESLAGLPEGLETLTCKNTNIQSLSGLPSTLKRLSVAGCGRLESLAGLPDGLVDLYCQKCSRLESLEDLPPSLQLLDCSGCAKVRGVKPPPGLKTLIAEGCKLDLDLRLDLLRVKLAQFKASYPFVIDTKQTVFRRKLEFRLKHFPSRLSP